MKLRCLSCRQGRWRAALFGDLLAQHGDELVRLERLATDPPMRAVGRHGARSISGYEKERNAARGEHLRDRVDFDAGDVNIQNCCIQGKHACGLQRRRYTVIRPENDAISLEKGIFYQDRHQHFVLHNEDAGAVKISFAHHYQASKEEGCGFCSLSGARSLARTPSGLNSTETAADMSCFRPRLINLIPKPSRDGAVTFGP